MSDLTVSNFAAYNNSDPDPLVRRCGGCGRPRDNAHPQYCPICLLLPVVSITPQEEDHVASKD